MENLGSNELYIRLSLLTMIDHSMYRPAAKALMNNYCFCLNRKINCYIAFQKNLMSN